MDDPRLTDLAEKVEELGNSVIELSAEIARLRALALEENGALLLPPSVN